MELLLVTMERHRYVEITSQKLILSLDQQNKQPVAWLGIIKTCFNANTDIVNSYSDYRDYLLRNR